MKKKAYTLAEILIALAIVGIVAAICIPMANKFRPDTTKILYLQTYDNLKQVLKLAANDNGYYPSSSGIYNFGYHPFAYIGSIQNHEDSQKNKLCRVLADTLVLSVEFPNINCSDDYTLYNENNFSPSFTLKNGIEVMVTTNTNYNTVNMVQASKTNRYQTDIIIDVNGAEEGPNHTYSDNVKHPDRFQFKVSADGSIRPVDYAGLYFLEHRTNLKKTDIIENADVRQLLVRYNREFPTFAIPRHN